MEERYYHHRTPRLCESKVQFERNENNVPQFILPYIDRPVATVCLVRNDSGEVGMGVALCSPRDQFSKKFGRDLARKRAFGAIVKRGDFGSLPWKYVGSRPYFLQRKGLYDPQLIEMPAPLRPRLEDRNYCEQEEQERVMLEVLDHEPRVPRYADAAECVGSME